MDFIPVYLDRWGRDDPKTDAIANNRRHDDANVAIDDNFLSYPS